MFNKYRWTADQSQFFFLLKLYLFYCLSGSTAVTIPLYTLLISRHTWVEWLERRRLCGCLTDTDGCLTVDRWPAPQPPHHWALTAADWSRRRTHTHTRTHTYGAGNIYRPDVSLSVYSRGPWLWLRFHCLIVPAGFRTSNILPQQLKQLLNWSRRRGGHVYDRVGGGVAEPLVESGAEVLAVLRTFAKYLHQRNVELGWSKHPRS